MSPVYVPPHMRGGPGAKAEEPERGERSDRGDRGGDRAERSERGTGGYPASERGGGERREPRRDQNSSGGRFDSLRDEGAPASGGKGKGGKGERRGGGKGESGGGAGGSSSAGRFADEDAGSSGAGIDWRKRPDGRQNRGGEETRTELEVFGEVKQRSTAGIDFDNYDQIPVQITGNDIADIVPIKRFSEAKLSDVLFENLRRCGYERPTPVQKHSIPIVVSGRDLMACAQTGSGKTCAFMVPCLESLLRSGPPANPTSNRRHKPMPCGLVLAPTRELAAQIHVESLKFSWSTGIRSCIIYGGADMREQRSDLDKGCDILIATPGRLQDMSERGHVSLEMIQFFILDEADRMLDMGFEPQVRHIVEQTGMGRSSRHRRQSMMFSATFAKEVQVMAQDFLRDYVFITVGRVGSASELVSQRVVFASEVKQKTHQLEKAIKDHLPADGLAVIFVETKKAADSLELDLHQSGVKVTAIHGDRTQGEREEALAAFKSGANPVLVATDVAARGLDIPNVALVVNFDMPKQLDDYVHRIGRTGRAGRKGVAVAFVNERCNYLGDLHDLLVEAKQEVPEWFGELCKSSRGRGFGGKSRGRGENRFGGQDLRLDAGPRGLGDDSKVTAVPTPMRSAPVASAAARAPNSWGNTGAEDAW